MLPRVQSALVGRAKTWYEKYGYQHYAWSDLCTSLVHTFSSGSDIVGQLANIDSSDFSTYTDFVMEKVSQISRLPFEIPEDKVIRIVIGCIADVGLRNSLTFVMPPTVQTLIDHLSSILESPRRRREFDNHHRRNKDTCTFKNPSTSRRSDSPLFASKRPRTVTDKKCFGSKQIEPINLHGKRLKIHKHQQNLRQL